MMGATETAAWAPPIVPLVGTKPAQDAIPKTKEPREEAPLTVTTTISATSSSHILISKQEQEICLLADTVIACMKLLQIDMEDLQEHINSQLDGHSEKPLYQWDLYTNYNQLTISIAALDRAVDELEPSYLPETQASSYRRRARIYSTTISKITIFVLGHMNRKCATCMDDLDASGLSTEAKQAAQTHITSEIAKVLEHCSCATTLIWRAFDSVEEHLQPVPSSSTVDATVRHTIVTMIENYKQNSIAEYEQRKVTQPSVNYYRMAAIWFVMSVALIYSTVDSLFPSASIPAPRPPPRVNDADIYLETMHLINRTNAVTTLTSEIYGIQLADLDNRYKALELAAEGAGLRIDNIVEALGTPNEQGNYYIAAQNMDVEGVRQRVQKMQENVEWRLQRLQNEMRQMRKTMHRMDIRLTGRLNKVGTGR